MEVSTLWRFSSVSQYLKVVEAFIDAYLADAPRWFCIPQSRTRRLMSVTWIRRISIRR